MDTHPVNSVDEQAARWAARAAYSGLTAEDRAALDTWLAADPRHRGAFLRARAGLYVMEDAVIRGQRQSDAADEDGRKETSVSRQVSRRTLGMAVGGMAMAACLAGLMFIGMPMLSIPGQPDVSRMELADGSTATLGEGAEISIAMSDDIRRITLQRGEATFQVARDQARPFVVRSGDVYAEATGTIYSVRRLGETGGAVRVSEGSVLVWAHEGREQAVLLHGGEELTLDPGADGSEAPPPLPPEVARISLDNVTISAAVERFNSVNQTKIIIDDPDIGDTTIVGLFDANDPEQFAQAVAAVTGARILRRDGNIVIIM